MPTGKKQSTDDSLEWWGLTGGIACGKTKVAELLRARGYSVVDADQLAREVVAPGEPAYDEIVQEFGVEVLQGGAKGQPLNRAKLAERVFSNPQELEILEKITHPRVGERTRKLRQQLAAKGEKRAFYDVPLLFEKGLEEQFDQIVVVHCDPDQQRVRLQSRDGLSREEIEKRLKAQWPISQKVSRADYVIDNSGAYEDLAKQVDRFLEQI